MATATAKSPAAVDFADDPVNRDLDSDTKVAFYRSMVRIRHFEQTALKHYQQEKMGGFLHLYIGQEAVAVGTISLCGDDDHIITAYRDHGHALAVGMSMEECMAELFGKRTGCSKGKGGSMHFFAPDKNYWGGHGIVGGQTPLGAGLAFALKYKGLKGACLCYLGDGAVNQGAYHESLNLAALWNLPVIYIIENNMYSMGTSQARSSAYPSCLAERAEGYGMNWDLFNGESLYEIRAKLKPHLDRAHDDHLPSILEIATYRYYGHSVADANAKKYRSKEEIEKYQSEHDPIKVWENILIGEGVFKEDDAREINRAAKDEADASARYADNSPLPDVSEITDDVYYEVDKDTAAGRTGRHFFND